MAEVPAAQVPFLAGLTAETLEILRGSLQLRVLSLGQRLWSEGQAGSDFSFVCRGTLKLVKSGEGGRDVIVDLGGPGEFLCASAVCTFAPYCCSAIALEDGVQVVLLSRRALFEALERSPAVAQSFLKEATGRGLGLCLRVREVASGRVERRVANLLLRLADRFGVSRGEEGIWVSLPLSRQDLADLCGTTIETAIRVMSRLARAGTVRSAPGGFLVSDRRALESIAQGGPRAGKG